MRFLSVSISFLFSAMGVFAQSDRGTITGTVLDRKSVV